MRNLLEANKLVDPVTNALNSHTGKLDKELTNLIEQLLEKRIELVDLFVSAFSNQRFFESVRADVQTSPEFPTVLFTVKDRTGRTLSPSRIAMKADGNLHVELTAPSDIRQTVEQQLISARRSPIIANKIKEIEDISGQVMELLSSNPGQ